jgi:hypothetical protein
MNSTYRILLLALAVTTSACDPATPPSQGAASISWSIADSGGSHQSCAAVGATSVSLLLHPRAGADVVATFPCIDGQGSTHLVSAGAYDATLTLRSEQGAKIASGLTQTVTLDGNQTIPLTPVVFTVSPNGSLNLTMTTLGTDSNCGGTGTRGAGVKDVAIQMVRADTQSCAGATLLRTRGDGTSNGAYLLSCFRPMTTTCIERDETLSTGTLAAGDYIVRASGLRDNVQCWSAARAFTLPGGGALADVALQLSPTNAPGC